MKLTSIIKRYNGIMCELGYDHVTIGEWDSEGTENWNLADMVCEAQYILECYHEEGHCLYDMKYDDPKCWRSETGKLKRFIERYKYILDVEKPSEGHCSNLG